VIVIPALDVRGGRCVRLIQGDYGRETVYDNDATTALARLLDQGARRVHLVNLDAARGVVDERSVLAVAAVVEAAAARGAEVEVGGGVRDEATARRWLDAGAAYIVLGSLAVGDPEAAEAICRRLPHRCLIALDVREGVAQAQGWMESAGPALVHIERWRSWPLAGLIRTNIANDGMLSGPDLEGLRHTAGLFPGQVIASGGISTVDDVARCAEAGAAGVIVGRALYEGSFDLAAALQRFPIAASSS